MSKQDDIIIGLMFGDEGKGTTVDFLASQETPKSVVRFSGGAQAAHNVILPDGTHHTFAQFGAASLRSIPTTLSQYMIVNPLTLVEEGDLIQKKSGWNPFPTLNISEKSLLTTPIHVWLNRKREEARGANPHGSCGVGVGETRHYSLTHTHEAPIMKDLEYASREELTRKLETLKAHAEETIGQKYDDGKTLPIEQIVESYLNLRADRFLNIVPDRKIIQIISRGYHIFEGSQGVLLDEWQGFHPHTTWSETTSKNAQKLLQQAGKNPGKVTGVTRSYLTRHGHGPFPSEIGTTQAETLFPETHNGYGTYQGGWRAGWFDQPLFSYAVKANRGVDAISITHMDRLTPETLTVESYGEDYPQFDAGFFGTDMDAKQEITDKLMALNPERLAQIESRSALISKVEAISDSPVEILSHGPRSDEKELR